MQAKILVLLGSFLFLTLLGADTLGFVEQKFGDLHFEKGKWGRSVQLPCYVYSAQQDGATVDVLRYGTNNFVSFKAAKGLHVTVCGSIAAFEEGFETATPVPNRTTQK